MKIYNKNRHCPKCDYDKTRDKWDYYPTKREYIDGILKIYETAPLVRRTCNNLSCKHVWDELPLKRS